MNVGFWMIWERGGEVGTILPTEGIGVYSCNLVRGILDADPAASVTVFCLEANHAELRRSLPTSDRLRIVNEAGSEPRDEPSNVSETPASREISRRSAKRAAKWATRKYRAARQPRQLLDFCKTKLGRRPGQAAFLALAPVFCLLLVIEAYTLATWRLAAHVGVAFRHLWGWLTASKAPADDSIRTRLEARLAGAGCDVLCVPTVNCTCPTSVPSVLLLYDLVTAHHTQGMSHEAVATSLRRAFENSRRATLVATSTDFIRKNDLEGVLGLSESKVRVVRTATPAGMAPAVSLSAGLEDFSRRPFLFYPSMNRPYKNIAQLVVALGLLHRKHGRTEVGLVLTSAGDEQSSVQLEAICDAFGLREHVKVADKLLPEEVALLYKRAAATVVPSLYEGIGLQFFEALEAGSPLVTSDIPTLREHAQRMGVAVPMFDPNDPADMARVINGALAERGPLLARQQSAYKRLLPRPWFTVAAEYLTVFSEAVHIRKGATELAPVNSDEGPYQLFLMLQVCYLGGVWIATRDLVRSLAQLNRTRKQLDLTLGLAPDQTDLGDLADHVRVERLNYSIMPASAARDLSDFDRILPPGDPRRGADEFSVLANPSALKADAWYALVDRFAAPLLPDRPHGVVVYDLIQHYVPQCFPEAFFPMYERAMVPTVRHANMVMTTNEVTRGDVNRFIGNAHDAVRMVPVCFEVGHRFHGTVPAEVALPRRPFVLNVNNGSPHKGIELMVRGHAKLCKRLGPDAPLLVVCGIFTNAYSKDYDGSSHDYDVWKRIRKLVPQLGLVEGRDVVFLGHVSDSQLMYLFQNCTAVVNSAKYDNGSFNLIEAYYFGKQAICNRYPAAEWLYERFRVPVHYFPVDDADGLANAMAMAMTAGPADVEAIRADLNRSELSMMTYAERVYDMLVELGRMGRAASGQIAASRATTRLAA